MPDFAAKQGDTAPVWSDTLTYSDGTVAVITGHTIKFVMRALTANNVTTNATATVVSGPAGTVSYTPTAEDTAVAGVYEGYWRDVTAGQTFPTVGRLTVVIEENLTTPGGARLVALGDVKDYLNFPATDRSHDAELMRFIDGVTPVVENITGPILQHVYQETYDGGFHYISLRHRPVIEVHEVVEYRGPIKYNLQQIPTPDLGTIYSYMFEPPGRIVRRTAGGGITTFPYGTDQIFVTYTAGFVKVPENVRMGTLELIRVNYQQTQQAGPPRATFGAGLSDEPPTGPALGFFVPNRVRELLSPNKRRPSIA